MFLISNSHSSQRVRRWLQKKWPLLILAVLPLLVLGPALHRGYILQYDMVFVPHPTVDWANLRHGLSLYNTLPETWLLQLCSHVLPMDVVQKAILWAIFFGAGVSLYYAVPGRSRTSRLLGAMAYSFNPFTYDRLMAGHWLFLAGYALLPLIFRSFVQALTKPSLKRILLAATTWTAAILCSSHWLVIGAILLLCLGLACVRSWQALATCGKIVAGLLLLNAWWLIPLFTTQNLTQNFGASELHAFASQTDTHLGLWFNLMAMHGFWYSGWQALAQLVVWWPLLTGIWLIPVFAGMANAYHRSKLERRWLIGLLFAGIVGLGYAAGPASWIGPINVWIFRHVPGMSGLREPQKLLSLLVLMYCVCIPYGYDLIFEYAKKRYLKLLVTAVGAASIALMASPMWWGAHGQMRPVSYSAGWGGLERQLAHARPGAKVVILPWNIYIDKGFMKRLTANPAPAYYANRQISSQRAGLQGVADFNSTSYLPLQAAIDQKDASGFVQAARRLEAAYVVLVSSDENQDYNWLSQTNALRLIHSDAQIQSFALTER